MSITLHSQNQINNVVKISDSTYIVNIDVIKTANKLFSEHNGLKKLTIEYENQIQSYIKLVEEKEHVNTLLVSNITTQNKLIDSKNKVIASKNIDIHNLNTLNKKLKKRALIPWSVATLSTILTIIVATK